MQINEALRDLFSESTKPLILAIDGPAGSGKSTLAGEIARAFAGTYDIEVIHLDELYNGWDQALSQELFQRISQVIAAQRAGKAIELSIYDWSAAAFSGSREVKAVQLLIIEGVGSSNQLLQIDLTTSIWLDIDQSIGLARVLERDGEDIRNEMVKWQKMESEYFARDLTRERADFILSTQ
ncbi:MAG: AAA family ATPase [Actinobacteria bacterium]|nr:AAA family ATPase [Actinomycetota bacterium]